MDRPTVTVCLDGTFRDLGVIDVARRRALLWDAWIRLVTTADPGGTAIELPPDEVDGLTGLQILCRSGELPRPGHRLKPRRRRATPVLGDSVVLAEENYGLLSAIDVHGGDGRAGTLVRVQERWAPNGAPALVGACVTSLRDAEQVLLAAGAEGGHEHVGLRVVYASGRPRRNRPLSAGDIADIGHELARMASVPIVPQVVAGDPYRLLTELSHSCRAVVIPGRTSILRTGPDGWRYPGTGCPLIVVPRPVPGVPGGARGGDLPGPASPGR